MKKMLLIFLLFIATTFGQYTTPGSGVNWTLDSLVLYSGGTVIGTFPNYTVSGLVTVSANDIVKVDAGSTVSFTVSTAGFTVNGAFQAIGTESSRIKFTSPTPDSLGAYNGLVFNDSSVDSLCIVKYSDIEFAYYACRAIGANPTYEYNNLLRNRRGFNISNSSMIIRNNTVLRSYEYGVTMTLNGTPLIENNTFGFNNTKATSAMNQISIGLQGTNSPIIRNNIIYGGESVVTGGISLWVSGASSDAIVENNTIYNNSFGITLYATGTSGTLNAVVRGNTIYGNKINPNTQTSGSGINVNGVVGNTPLISHNTIYDNWWGITIQNGTSVQAGPNPRLGNLQNADTTDDGYNKIYNNIQPTGTFDLYNNCTNDIYAQNNDWGVYDSTSIEANIFHKVDNAAHGTVFFMPFYDPSLIPVELVSFSAIQRNEDIFLKWVTSTETNNKGFYIDRQSKSESWKEISFISGKGSVISTQSYSYSDRVKKNGNYSYRLRQVDFDGTEKILSQAEVNFVNQPKTHSLAQNYPNPFNPSTKISYSVGGNSDAFVTLKIFNLLGKELAVIVNEKKSPGSYEIELNLDKYGLSGLSSGVYFYQLNINNVIQTKKFLINK
jgi:hypothetical protein